MGHCDLDLDNSVVLFYGLHHPEIIEVLLPHCNPVTVMGLAMCARNWEAVDRLTPGLSLDDLATVIEQVPEGKLPKALARWERHQLSVGLSACAERSAKPRV